MGFGSKCPSLTTLKVLCKLIFLLLLWGTSPPSLRPVGGLLVRLWSVTVGAVNVISSGEQKESYSKEDLSS